MHCNFGAAVNDDVCFRQHCALPAAKGTSGKDVSVVVALFSFHFVRVVVAALETYVAVRSQNFCVN